MTTRTFFFFILLYGCASSPSKQHTLRISFNSIPSSVDPGTCGDLASSSLVYLLYEGLTRSSNGVPEQALAEKIEISNDRLTYLFYLRPSNWSDGRPVTAYDFERSWKKVLDPQFPSIWPSLFYPIKNAERAHKREVSADQIGVYALNDHTLKVVLEYPTPYFLTLTTFLCYLPSPSYSEQKLNIPLISNGPFLLQSVIACSKFILSKNKNYWNSQKIKLDEIQIDIIRSEATALQMFENGELDLVGGIEAPLPLDSLPNLRKQYCFSFAPIPATTFCSFNTHHPLLKNKNLRKALSCAIDRDSITKNITQMEETAAVRPVPPLLSQNPNRQFYPAFSPEQAQKFLNQALEELGIEKKQLNQLVLLFSFSETNRKIATTLKSFWEETLGISVSLECCEKQALRERLFKNNYDVALYFWLAQFEDPIAILERFQDPENLKNTPHWHNEDYCRFLTLANEALTLETRSLYLEMAEEVFCEEMPLAPIYHWSNGWICQPSIKEISAMPSGLIQFERISKAE